MNSSAQARVEPQPLLRLTTEILSALGTPAEIAHAVADHLVLAMRSGYPSHGIAQLRGYARQVGEGTITPSARPEIVAGRGGATAWDGQGGWGMFAARVAVEDAIVRAAEHGIAVASLTNCSHIGRLGHYTELAAARGAVSLVTFGDGSAGEHLAAPYGSAVRALSTNPISAGAPTRDHPFIADFATTAIANAKTWAYAQSGEPLPEGVALDAAGHPTRDAAAYLEGGSLVIFGGHKGSALSILTCVLAAMNPRTGADRLTGSTFVVIDVSAFGPSATYRDKTESFLDSLRELPPASGHERVLMPGDFEADRRKVTDESIPVAVPVLGDVVALAEQLGVNVDGF
jgi:L-lactate dehydrogenase